MKYNLNNPTLLYFYADWCGHCQHFSPTFEKFESNINNSKLNIIKFNADKDKKYVQSFGVEGFPTLIFHDLKNNRFIDYRGNRTITDLVKFVNENGNIDVTK
jgi:protein disulfide-isomerase-like protein